MCEVRGNSIKVKARPRFSKIRLLVESNKAAIRMEMRWKLCNPPRPAFIRETGVNLNLQRLTSRNCFTQTRNNKIDIILWVL